LKKTLFFLILAISQNQLFADVVLSPLFGNGMVLQRSKPVSIWGKASPGETIVLTFGSASLKTKAAKDSTWKLQLAPQSAGGPHTLKIKGKNEITLQDVYFGEVWIASGQSNMELKLKQPVKNNTYEMTNANFPLIRYIDVKNRPAAQPQWNFESKGWTVCSPQTAGDFSAVAYFFARGIFQKTNVPIGIIQTEWGGTPAEAWTSKEALQSFPEFNEKLKELSAAEEGLNSSPAYKELLAKFNTSLLKSDAGTKGEWWKSELPSENEWNKMSLPNHWEKAGLEGFDGAVWFRKEVTVSEQFAKEKDLKLRLSTIDDMDSTWLNGVKIGGLRGWDRNRNFSIPDGLLKPGKNVIAIRVIDWIGNGGINGQKEDIVLSGKNEEILLGYLK